MTSVRFAALIVFAASLPLFVHDAYLLQVGTLTLLYAYLASSWNILGGFAGQFSLGHAAFFGTGAYVATMLQLQNGVNPWMGMLVAAAAGGFLSVLLGLPSFRLRGPYYSLTTIAFAELTRIGVMNTRQFLGWDVRGARGLLIPSIGQAPLRMQSLHKAFYFELALALLAFAIGLSAWLKRRNLGHQWAAIREDEQAAACLGINVLKAKLIAAFLSGALTAVGGVFYAQLVLYVDPARVFGLDMSVEMAVLALVGGSGTVWGPLLGVLALRSVAEWAQWTSGSNFRGIHLLLYGGAMMVVVMAFPRGIAGFRWRSARSGRVAEDLT
jgi:branched-chain amino acid transport system permease protein